MNLRISKQTWQPLVLATLASLLTYQLFVPGSPLRDQIVKQEQAAHNVKSPNNPEPTHSSCDVAFARPKKGAKAECSSEYTTINPIDSKDALAKELRRVGRSLQESLQCRLFDISSGKGLQDDFYRHQYAQLKQSDVAKLMTPDEFEATFRSGMAEALEMEREKIEANCLARDN